MLQLALHWQEPLLFSSSADNTIRIWNIETFVETYKLHIHEPILNFKLMSKNSILYTTYKEVIVCDLSLSYRLFSNIGSQAIRLSRVTAKGLPSRIVFAGKDGGIRLLSPVYGIIINIAFPIVGYGLKNILHVPRCNASYICLENGNVLVFTTETNPCRL